MSANICDAIAAGDARPRRTARPKQRCRVCRLVKDLADSFRRHGGSKSGYLHVCHTCTQLWSKSGPCAEEVDA